MKNLILDLFLGITLLFGVSFDDGLSAYQKGDFKTALFVFEDLASEGNAKAQYFLGVMYQNGEGVRQDYKKAFEWYERAALQGDAEAQHTLALIYENGTGVKQDFEKAREWHKKAALQGHTISKYFIGDMHINGEDVGKDYDDGIQDGHNIYKELLRERAF